MIPRRMIDDVIRRNPQDPADQQQDNSTVIQPRMSPYGQNVENANNGDIGSIVPSRTPEQANALYAPQAQMGHADMGSALSRGGDISSLAPRNRMDSQTINYMQEDYNNGLKYSLPPAVAPPADRYQAEQTPVLDPHSRALAEPKGTYKAPGLKGRLWEGAKAFLMGGGVQGAMRGLFDVYGREKHDQDIAQRTEDLANQDKQLIQRNQANLGAEKFNDLQSAREQDRALQERQFQQSNENHSITERRLQQALADKEEASSIAQRQSQSKMDELGRHNKEREDAHKLASEVQGIYQRMKTTTPNSTDMLVLQQRLAEIQKQPFTSDQAEVMRDRGILGKDSNGNQILINPYSGEAKNVTMAGSGVNGQPSINVRVYNAPSRGGGGASQGYDAVDDQKLIDQAVKYTPGKGMQPATFRVGTKVWEVPDGMDPNKFLDSKRGEIDRVIQAALDRQRQGFAPAPTSDNSGKTPIKPRKPLVNFTDYMKSH